MNRPTITLACIMRDEMVHLKGFLESIKGCFDEVWLTDTGSIDGSKEFAKSIEASMLCGCPIKVKEFTWIDDFAAARNYSMEGVATDYVMWLDLDDRMSSAKEFIRWRDNVMGLADFWLATYNYATDDKGNVLTAFTRERVIKTKKKFAWKYPVHEGMMATEHVVAQFANNWAVNHARTKEDYEKDFSRNVTLLERLAKNGELHPRLKFYYGKELFDKGRMQEAYTWLDQVVDNKELEHHDRILTFEYLCRSSLHRFYQEQEHKPIGQQDPTLLAKAAALALQGATLEPNRAEFYCLAGDAFVKLRRDHDALPMYGAATRCTKQHGNGFLFVSHAAYEHIPLDQMARIKFKQGLMDEAIFLAQDSFKRFQKAETSLLLKEMLEAKEKVLSFKNTDAVQTDEVVFTCLNNPYPFDEDTYRKKGIGGSETALVEVAYWMKRIDQHRRVVVFQNRPDVHVSQGGVEYRPLAEMHGYFQRFKPAAHYAWRHNAKLTNAKTYLWCHDLFTPGAEMHEHYEKHICLTPFHKEYVQVNQKIPESKFHMSRNGVNKERFLTQISKNENKIVFPSSPDRGLEHAIHIVEKAREKSGKDLELHVYYGIEHLEKYGPQMKALGEKLKVMFSERPWVKYHGNVDQARLAREMQEAAVWLYPATFIESFCITGIEAMYAKCFPLVREIGALKDTMRPFHDLGMAKLFYREADDYEAWSIELLNVLKDHAWERINMQEFDYSWRGVAEDFLEMAFIEKKESPVVSFGPVDVLAENTAGV